VLSIDPALLEHPTARLAHYRGLLQVKAEALRDAERLAGWARPLLVSVQLVSFLHLWHQIARIAPEGVPALPLPAWMHWLSAALLTASVDATALYLLATRSAARYAQLGEQGRWAVWFFYVLTWGLNTVFVLSYTPGLPAAVQGIVPLLSLLGAVLLGLLVPVSMAAVESARQVVVVTRQLLVVEVERLRGVVAEGVTVEAAAPLAETPAMLADAPTVEGEDEAPQGSTVGIPGISQPVVDRACPSCGVALDAAQYGAARRWGWCRSCKSERSKESS
jgi:hypothetical protein